MKAKIAPSPCYASMGRQVRWRGALPLVRWARANVFGLRAFARDRWKIAMAYNCSSGFTFGLGFEKQNFNITTNGKQKHKC
jgi:hypothetical protein